MNFAELVAAVYVETGRPNLVNETSNAIQSVTLNVHASQFWGRDMQEALYPAFSTSNYNQTIDLTTLTRFRIFQSIRIWDPTAIDTITGAAGAATWPFDEVPPDKLFDPTYKEYLVRKRFIYWLAGDTAKLKSAITFQQVEIKYYSYPITDPATYASWIARDHPWVIVHGAAAKVSGDNGNVDGQKAQQTLYQESYTTLLTNHLEAQAR